MDGPDNAAHFAWAAEARLRLGARLISVDEAAAVPFHPVLPDRPAAEALAGALAGRGRAFRIGGRGAAPEGLGIFETLTGGSTGTPRRIRRSMASWTASFAVNARLFGLGPGRRTAVLGRLVHSLALYGALETLHLGAELHLLAGARPDRQRQALARFAVDLLYATPAQMRLLAAAPGPDLPALCHLLIGGSKLDDALRQAVLRLAPGVAIHEFYGAAEASFITLAGPGDEPASVGRAYPGVALAIRDARGQAVPPGAPGEVWVQSPYLFQAYAGAPGSARWGGGWLSVGEYGRLVDGALYLAGRNGRRIKIADQSVHPEDIEAFLLAQPGVAQAAVLPRPDARRGQHLVAFLQGGPADEVLLALLRQAFGPLVAPRAILRPAHWPALASGKTDLSALGRLT